MFAGSPELFFYLLVGHALGDSVFQGGDLARLKRRAHNPGLWPIFLFLHGGIHGSLDL